MPPDSPATQRAFRNAMGLFATGVTVITTRAGEVVHGMTVNGFMSVSLDPRLIVVSISDRARMSEMLATSGVYGVSVLAAEQRQLSAHFAGRPMEDGSVAFVELAGVPVIAGALVRVSARVTDAHPAGDHVLFIGEVTNVELDEGDPLVFHGGSYRALEAPVEIAAHWSRHTDWF